ncbi:cullin-1-like, partial [Trifolium medium]|nr:cullin-1-like [Trifolium medium]
MLVLMFGFLLLTVYDLCNEEPYYTVEMYEKYKETCEEYIRSKVYEGMNKEIMDAIFAMMGRKLAGEMIDQTFVNTILVFYLRFYKWTKE